MYELHLSENVESSLLVKAIAHSLGISESVIEICEDSEIGRSPVGVVRLHRAGEFPLSIALYPDKSLATKQESEFAAQIAKYLKVSCLITDHSENPYRWFKVDSNGLVETVFVDTKALDEEQIFVLDKLR